MKFPESSALGFDFLSLFQKVSEIKSLSLNLLHLHPYFPPTFLENMNG